MSYTIIIITARVHIWYAVKNMLCLGPMHHDFYSFPVISFQSFPQTAVPEIQYQATQFGHSGLPWAASAQATCRFLKTQLSPECIVLVKKDPFSPNVRSNAWSSCYGKSCSTRPSGTPFNNGYDKPFRRWYSKPLEAIKAGKLLLLLAGVSMNK